LFIYIKPLFESYFKVFKAKKGGYSPLRGEYEKAKTSFRFLIVTERADNIRPYGF